MRGQVREACASESWQRPGAFPHDSADGRAIVTLFDIVDAGTFLRQVMLRGGNIHYRKPMTPRLAALAQAGPKDDWPILDYQQAAAWENLLRDAVTVQVRRHLRAGDPAPGSGRPLRKAKSTRDRPVPLSPIFPNKNWQISNNQPRSGTKPGEPALQHRRLRRVRHHPAVIASRLPELWYLLRLIPTTTSRPTGIADHGISVYVPRSRKPSAASGTARCKRPSDLSRCDVRPPTSRPISAGSSATPRESAVSLNTTATRCASRLASMDQIRKFEIKLNRDPERRKFKANQRIRITDGPFELWEGRVETLDTNYRLGVLIDLLGREVRIKLDEDQVEAV